MVVIITLSRETARGMGGNLMLIARVHNNLHTIVTLGLPPPLSPVTHLKQQTRILFGTQN